MASSNSLTSAQNKRNAYMQLKLQANAVRAQLARKERDKLEAIEREKEEQRLLKEDEVRRKEEARLAIETEYKTKEYFNMNKALRRTVPTGAPVYFGDNVQVYGGWYPHGEGEMRMHNKVQYCGHYTKGVADGLGTYNFDDGSRWTGMFRGGSADGPGQYFKAPQVEGAGVARPDPSVSQAFLLPEGPTEALMRKNVIVCFKPELVPGKQVELHDPTLRLSTSTSEYNVPRATLLRHVCKWRYVFRFHDEVIPREREVNLETIRAFKVLHHLPSILTLSQIDLPMDYSTRYNYYLDNYGDAEGAPRLGVAVGRRNEEMGHRGYLPALKAPQRKVVPPHSLNIFESGLSGIAAAQDAELKKEQIKNRKIQWAKIVDQKRVFDEQDRHRQIEESQKQMALEQRAEMEQMRQQLLVDVEAAMSVYSSPSHSPSRDSVGAPVDTGAGVGVGVGAGVGVA